MKYMKHKKSNSTTDRGSGEVLVGPNGPIHYKLEYVIPAPYRAACHMHKKPVLFMTIRELQKHILKEHRVWKG